MSTSTRWLIGIGVALGALVLVAVGAALATQGRQTPEYPEGTPEGAVQRYLRALAGEDTTRAYAFLAPDLQVRCPEQEWRDQAQWSHQQLEDAQVLLKEVERPAEREAVVLVEIRHVQMGQPFPLPPNESSFEQSFRLRQQDDSAWRFSEPPWPVYGCRDFAPQKPA